MVVGFASLVLVCIVLFALHGTWRGIRSVILTTGTIFFAVVMVLFAGDAVLSFLRKVGLPLDTGIVQALLFAFTLYSGDLVLRRIVRPPLRELPLRERIGGLSMGAVNGFFIITMLMHYLGESVAATGNGSMVSFGVPDLTFSHPGANTWSVTLTPSSFTLLPPTPDANLWAKLPIALVLLLLFLGFTVAGTVYGRLSNSRG